MPGMDAGEMNKLEGIFTQLLVPLDERDRVNDAEFRRFVSWLIERGVYGVYPVCKKSASASGTAIRPSESENAL